MLAARPAQLPATAEDGDESSLLAFMQAFEGDPYGIEWATGDRIAHLEMTNDITQPGALPVVEIDVNGRTVSLILDTGGDRLYLDMDIYASLGLSTLASRQARYAYTGGQPVEEPLGVAETVKMGDVTLTNVPVIGATWKALGQTSDGVFTTQILKQFWAPWTTTTVGSPCANALRRPSHRSWRLSGTPRRSSRSSS